MSDTFPFLTNYISASMIHTTKRSVETKRTGKIYLIQKGSACYYVKFSFNDKHKAHLYSSYLVWIHKAATGNIFEMVKIEEL